ncbi:hypothetical protein OIU76_004603 [Salix suchowensis]|uniref:HXXXD-type acyl-transferase family protein n=1 Tax=Salix suchowensis TaxID=1278906 RepID=A0ABQ9BQM2_9ROSI|nr:hypothetical protein OIU76_004603 [Salix suchowensis]KAJ6389429.1 hypothetical protein OIU77_027708 [Salix suchowensis]
MVQATTDKVKDVRIELTQCDLKLLLVGAIQKGLLFIKPKSLEDQNSLIHHLKTSLSRTLDFFNPLAGRLATVEHDDSTVSFFIDCNNAGAQFVHAAADGVTMADILHPVYVPPIVHSFFPLNGVLNYEAVSKPLLAVQVTELADGIFVGCTMNHAAVDGTSFWNFFNSWSEIHRGLDQISNTPVLERWEKIAMLKAKANAEAASTSISSLQSLLAHIWRATTRTRLVEHDKETNLLLLIGLRTRLQPPLPGSYCGNAVVTGIVTLRTGEILEHGLGFVALEINKVVSSYTKNKLKDALESSLKNPGPLTMAGIAFNKSLAISSSPRHNVYGPDFGWGRAVAVRSGSANKFDGKVTLFPGLEEGSMDIELSVLPETLKALENDLEFMDAVTIISS